MASTFADFGSTLFAAGVLPDPANPTMNIAFVGTSGMGLPDRDYYLLDKYKPQRDAYRAYIERTFDLIGTPNAAAAADRVLAFETEIAKLSWPQADLRDLDKLNNPMTLGAARCLRAGPRLEPLSDRHPGRVAQADRRRQYGGEGPRGAL